MIKVKPHSKAKAEMLTFRLQIVFKAKPQTKANTETKALKAVRKRQVFAISDKGGKGNGKAYDADTPQKGAHGGSVQYFPIVIGRAPAASRRLDGAWRMWHAQN